MVLRLVRRPPLTLDRRAFNRLSLSALAGAAGLGFPPGHALAQTAAPTPITATEKPAAEKFKVAWVYVGPVSDHGWSYQHDQGRQGAERALGDRIATTFVENVPEGPDSERVIEQLAASGHKLIFTTSYGFMESTLKVAQRHPEVLFENATGVKRAKNVATYASRFYEGRTVIGLMAGKMTRSNVVGYIGAYPIPEVINSINAFALGLRETNPQAVLRVEWANSWYDPAKETEIARGMIEMGADVLTQHTDSPAPITVAQERGIFAFGQSSDMTRFGSRAHLTSLVDDWDEYYVSRINAAMAGQWTSGDFWGGFKDHMLHLAPYNPLVPAEVVALADQAKADIIAGTRHPFPGPIKDQSGQERVATGQTASDEQIHKMDWLVDGIIGRMPK